MTWLRWTGLFLLVTIEVTAIGALAGGIVFPILGAIFDWERGWAELAMNGIKNIGFWAFIWAPGIALVRCVIHAHREKYPDASA